MHCTSYMCMFLYKLCSSKLTQVSSCHYFLLYSETTSRSSYDKMRNDRKEKCDDFGNKHILKAHLSLFYDIYLFSDTQKHLA